MLTTPKISIALPSHENVPVRFAYDLASLYAVTVGTVPEDWQIGLTLKSGTYVHAARQELAESALAQGITHMMWVDSDMSFPRDGLLRLLAHNKDIVGCNYSTRGLPASPVAIKEAGNDEKIGRKLQTTPESTGIEEVDAIGFGFVLMKTRVLAALPKGKPWFWFEYLPKRKQMIGEDVYFCNLARKAGFKIYVDHDLSKSVNHLGQFEYALNLIPQQGDDAGK
jgi:hypothetical protein